MLPVEGWRNWTGDERCRPARLTEPASVDDVVAEVRRARGAGQTVRVAGSGHSFNDAVLTDDVLLALKRMNRVLSMDDDDVRVEAGIPLHVLNAALDDVGLALPNLGDIDRQTIAGAIATGTHGTGARLFNISAAVREVEMVTGTGEVVRVDESSDADGWRAARVNLGALGVVTTVSLRCVPAFNLHGVDRSLPLDDVLAGLDDLADGNDHFEFYVFPYARLAYTRTNNRTDDPPRPRSRLRSRVDDIAGNELMSMLARTARRFPEIIPAANRLAARLWGGSNRIDRSHRVFCSTRRLRFTETEYAVPRERAVEAVERVLRTIEARRFDVPLPIEVRFAAGDDAFLSPAHDRATCHISVHQFEGMEWRRPFAAVEEVLYELGGRPHWGKRHSQTHDTLAPLYPEWSAFQAARRRFDADGVFANDYVLRTLGAP